MSLSIEYRDSAGRKHNSLAEMLKADVGRLVDETVKDVERAVLAQGCPVRGQRATVSISKSGGGFSFTIDGCCDDFVQRAERAARSAAA